MSDNQSGKIEVSLDLAKDLIPILESRIKAFDVQLEGVKMERGAAVRSLEELRAKVKGHLVPATNGIRKRLPKGKAETIIAGFLTAIQDGATIQDIVAQTGVSYSSAFRILNKNKKGLFDNPNGVWIVKQKK